MKSETSSIFTAFVVLYTIIRLENTENAFYWQAWKKIQIIKLWANWKPIMLCDASPFYLKLETQRSNLIKNILQKITKKKVSTKA